MNAARLSRFAGILLLAAAFAAIVVSTVRSEDPRRFAGYDATRSLTAAWPEAGLDFFTDGPRRALYVRQAGGRAGGYSPPRCCAAAPAKGRSPPCASIRHVGNCCSTATARRSPTRCAWPGRAARPAWCGKPHLSWSPRRKNPSEILARLLPASRRRP